MDAQRVMHPSCGKALPKQGWERGDKEESLRQKEVNIEGAELDFGCLLQLQFQTFTLCFLLAAITMSTLSGKDSSDRLMSPLFPNTLCPK